MKKKEKEKNKIEKSEIYCSKGKNSSYLHGFSVNSVLNLSAHLHSFPNFLHLTNPSPDLGALNQSPFASVPIPFTFFCKNVSVICSSSIYPFGSNRVGSNSVDFDFDLQS